MIKLFLTSLFLTLIILRVVTHNFHDMENYGTRNEKSKTLTGLLRNKTGFDFHHIHFGFLLLLITLIYILILSVDKLSILSLAISLSLIFDQLLPWLDMGNYFSDKMLAISVIFHMIIALISTIIYLISN